MSDGVTMAYVDIKRQNAVDIYYTALLEYLEGGRTAALRELVITAAREADEIRRKGYFYGRTKFMDRAEKQMNALGEGHEGAWFQMLEIANVTDDRQRWLSLAPESIRTCFA